VIGGHDRQKGSLSPAAAAAAAAAVK